MTFDELTYRMFRVLTWLALLISAAMGIELRLELAVLLWLLAAMCFGFSIWVRENSPHHKR